MVALANSFEGGVAGVTIDTVNSGGASGDIFNRQNVVAGGTLAFDETQKAHGLRSMLASTGVTAGVAYVGWNIVGLGGEVPMLWQRMYLFAPNAPGVNQRIGSMFSGAGNLAAGLQFQSGTRKIRLLDNPQVVQATSGLAIPTTGFVRIEWVTFGSPVAGHIEAWLFLNPDSQVPDEILATPWGLNTFGPVNEARHGLLNSVANYPQTWFDDAAISSAGPLGPAAVPVIGGLDVPALLNRDPLDSTNAPLNIAQSYTGPWLPTYGFSQVACMWASVGGATVTVTVEESLDGGVTADRSTSAGTAGANGPALPTKVDVVCPFVRMKVAVSVANATTLKAAMHAMG